MTGWEQNDDPASFWQADVDEAAERLAAILREEQADVVVRLRLARQLRPPRPHPGPPRRAPGRRPGRHAAALRGHVQPRRSCVGADGRAMPTADEDFDPNGPADDGNPFGTPEAEINLAVDVSAYIGAEAPGARRPRQPGHRHRHVPRDARGRCSHAFFGTEWFIEPGAPRRACATAGCSEGA